LFLLEERFLFGFFGSVFRATLFPVLNTHRIQGTTDDVVSYTWEVFNPSSSNEDNGMFLKVVANTRNIGSDFYPIR